MPQPPGSKPALGSSGTAQFPARQPAQDSVEVTVYSYHAWDPKVSLSCYVDITKVIVCSLSRKSLPKKKLQRVPSPAEVPLRRQKSKFPRVSETFGVLTTRTARASMPLKRWRSRFRQSRDAVRTDAARESRPDSIPTKCNCSLEPPSVALATPRKPRQAPVGALDADAISSRDRDLEQTCVNCKAGRSLLKVYSNQNQRQYSLR